MLNDNSNDSLKPNFGDNEDMGNDLKDLLDNNYEDNIALPEFNNLVSKVSVNDKDQEFYLDAEKVLTAKEDLPLYSDTLNKILTESERLVEERTVGLVTHVMGVNSAVQNQQPFFLKVLLFLRGLWEKLGTATSPDLYRKVLEEILNEKHPFYSIRIAEEVSDVLQIYLPDEAEGTDEGSIEQILESIFTDHFAQEGHQPIPVEDLLYQFVHHKFAVKGYRADLTMVKLNMMLVGKAPEAHIRHQLLEEWQEGLLIKNYPDVDKKILENYLTEIMGLACDEPLLALKYILAPIEWLLAQEEQMDRKILGLKLVGMGVELARERDRAGWSDQLAAWMEGQKLADNYMRESTHSRMMQQMPIILRFLYDHGALSGQFLSQVIRSSLHS